MNSNNNTVISTVIVIIIQIICIALYINSLEKKEIMVLKNVHVCERRALGG